MANSTAIKSGRKDFIAPSTMLSKSAFPKYNDFIKPLHKSTTMGKTGWKLRP